MSRDLTPALAAALEAYTAQLRKDCGDAIAAGGVEWTQDHFLGALHDDLHELCDWETVSLSGNVMPVDAPSPPPAAAFDRIDAPDLMAELEKSLSSPTPRHRLPPESAPQDGDERNEHGKTYRYHAADDAWLVKGEARVDPFDGNTMVRYDQETSPPASRRVAICDALGGHNGYVEWTEWITWEVLP